MAFNIRDYRAGELEALWQIDQQCFPEGIAYSREELSYYLKRRDALRLVAESGAAPAEIVGFLIAVAYRGAGHIITIDILPAARRTGLGSELMRRAEQHFRDAGLGKMRLETAVNNEAALNFYKRHGYFVTGTLPRYYLGSLDGLRMEKALVLSEKAAKVRP